MGSESIVTHRVRSSRRLTLLLLLSISLARSIQQSKWQVLNHTSTDTTINPRNPDVVCDTWQCCAEFCEKFLPKCAAVTWNYGNTGACNFRCASNHTTHAADGIALVIVRPNRDLCMVPDPPPPPHLIPTIHFAPNYVFEQGNWHDIAGAITHNGVHHVYQGQGWNHAFSTDLVHWQTGPHGPKAIDETYAGMRSHITPCSGYLTKDDSNRVCAGFRQCSSTKGVTGMPHPWDVPLELRCALDDNMTAWSQDPEYLFNVSFWRPVPYDPARPWRDSDGQWSQLLSLDACNASGLPSTGSSCPPGGQLGLWRSPALRGPEAEWRYVGPVFTSNETVLEIGFLHREFVTINLVGMLEGDPAPKQTGAAGSGTRLFFNNVGGNGGGDGCCHGTTAYFPVVQPSPDAPFEQVGPQGMVDWGAFTFADGVSPGQVPPPNATGVQLLWGMESRGLSMARTLGSEERDQVTRPGRRVMIGWIGPADWRVRVQSIVQGSAQSLPRELSLAPDRSLLQRFVPELRVLRRKRVEGVSVSVAGLQAEVLATFEAGCAAKSRPEGPCGIRLGAYGEVLLGHHPGLLTLDLTAGNNLIPTLTNASLALHEHHHIQC